MEIIKLPEGERAPVDTDCISIIRRSDGRHDLNGSALLRCGDGDEVESVALIGGDPYESYDAAEAAGLAWAADHCVGKVFISTVGE